MKLKRYFFTAASALFVLLTLAGFYRFYLAGHDSDGAVIPPALLALVVTHGVAVSAWIALFFVQSVLISGHRRQLHMKLGWVTAAVALIIVVSGPIVAVVSPRLRGDFPIFGMTYLQFMFPMFVEIAAFGTFVALGIVYRKRPAVHRAMLLLATLSVLSGATSRTPFFQPLFGGGGWLGLFGPMFAIGAILLIARTVITGTFDRPFANGFAALVLAYVFAMNFAVTSTWTGLAHRIAGRPLKAPAAQLATAAP